MPVVVTTPTVSIVTSVPVSAYAVGSEEKAALKNNCVGHYEAAGTSLFVDVTPEDRIAAYGYAV